MPVAKPAPALVESIQLHRAASLERPIVMHPARIRMYAKTYFLLQFLGSSLRRAVTTLPVRRSLQQRLQSDAGMWAWIWVGAGKEAQHLRPGFILRVTAGY